MSASLSFNYQSAAFVIHGQGTVQVAGLHDDGDFLHLSMYLFSHLLSFYVHFLLFI